jgi:hypothetical protein
MKTFKISLVTGLAVLAFASVVAHARAQATPQTPPQFKETVVVVAGPKTGSTSDYYLTFSGPVGVPGVTLPQGTYIFRFPVQGATVIQVLKADRSAAYAMFHTIPVENVDRSSVSETHDVTWTMRAPDTPPAIKAWFLPNQTAGYEFVYPSLPGTLDR